MGTTNTASEAGSFPRRRRLSGLGLGAIAVVIWSGSFVLTRFGVRTTLNAYDITALRFGFAAFLLFPVVWRNSFAVGRLGVGGFLILVSGTGAPYALLIAIGLQFASPADAAALIPGPMSVMAALLSAFVLKEPLPIPKWIGVTTILLGSLLIGALSGFDTRSVGHAFFLCAAALWAGYVVVLRRANLSALHATAIVAVTSAVTYLPLYVVFLPNGLHSAPVHDVAVQALYQGGLTTVIALVVFNKAVLLLGPAEGAALPALVPIVTLALAAPLLNELPTTADIVAACLIAVGVALVTSSKKAERKEKT